MKIAFGILLTLLVITVNADEANSVLDLGNFEIEGEVRRPMLNYINTDRKFDQLVDDTILVNYDDLEKRLTQFSLPNEKVLIEDENGNLIEEEI